MLKIGVSAAAQELRLAILGQVESPNPDSRIENPTRAGFFYYNMLFGGNQPLTRVDDNGYGLLGDHSVESEKAKDCFLAIAQASQEGGQKTRWLVHSLPFQRLDVCATDSPLARLQNHLLPGECLTRVDLVVGLDTLEAAIETVQTYLGGIEPPVVINTERVPFHLFDTQVINHDGSPDVTIWQFNRETYGLTLTE